MFIGACAFYLGEENRSRRGASRRACAHKRQRENRMRETLLADKTIVRSRGHVTCKQLIGCFDREI